MTSSFSFAVLDRFVADLEHQIQAAIADISPASTPTIRCRFQQGRLLVLSEDQVAAVTAADRDQRFKALALAMGQELEAAELLPDEILDDNGEVSARLYLRELGTASPYAARTWNWQPTVAIAESADVDTVEDSAPDLPTQGTEVTSSSLGIFLWISLAKPTRSWSVSPWTTPK